MKYTIYSRFISKKNNIIFLFFLTILFQGAYDSYNGKTIRHDNEENVVAFETVSYKHYDESDTYTTISAQLALQVWTYLRYSKRPISALYEEPLIHDDVYNFLVNKVGSKEITETILFFIEKENLPIETVFALVFTESKFDPSASNSNARSKDFGLFQLNSRTFRHLTAEELFDLETNVMLGTQYLKYAYSLMRTTDKALAVYNAGPSRPLRGIIPPITQNYIKKIQRYTQILIKEFSQYMKEKYPLVNSEET